MLPSTVELTINKLTRALQLRVPGLVQSVYLYGSVALDAYVEGTSDIDFVAIVTKPLTAELQQGIAEAHRDVEFELPKTDLMGAYLQQEQLGLPAPAIRPLTVYYEKTLHTDGHGADLNPVTWYTLKHYGLCVYGPAAALEYDASIEPLLRYVIRNMNGYWLGWVRRLEERLGDPNLSCCDSLVQDMMDEAVEWCVLGMLRQLYTIREHGITSKLGAGEYGLRIVPAQWRGLIVEAVAIKRREPLRLYESQQQRLRELVELLRYVHAESNRLYEELPAE